VVEPYFQKTLFTHNHSLGKNLTEGPFLRNFSICCRISWWNYWARSPNLTWKSFD